jgi:formylmethanofuran dehydrogenase subunit E
MATDYDAPRENLTEDSLTTSMMESPIARRANANKDANFFDEADLNESLEFPGADLSSLSSDELASPIQLQRAGEFVCSGCFLVSPRHRRARTINGRPFCLDCA